MFRDKDIEYHKILCSYHHFAHFITCPGSRITSKVKCRLTARRGCSMGWAAGSYSAMEDGVVRSSL